MKIVQLAGLAAGLGALAGPALAVPALFPSMLSGNTTGFADSLFTGAPDGSSANNGVNWVGIGGQTVTFDFGLDRVDDGAGQDFNVYEVNYGSPEFGLITVAVSIDGSTFFDISASAGAWIDLDGDEAHGVAGFARSYDLDGSGLAQARFVRIDGNGTGAAGGTNAFDLDAIGAANFTLALPSVPLPAALPLLAGGLAGLAFLRRRRG
jgi:hypothetical protein